KINVIDSVNFPCSIGLFYTAFTQFLGFPHYGDEYKIMGLAPYGKPEYLEKMKDIIRPTENGLFAWNSKYFTLTKKGGLGYEKEIPVVPTLYSTYFVEQFGAPRNKEQEVTQRHKNIASSVQK